MLNRVYIPDHIPVPLREKYHWFLDNFEIEFLYCSYWDNPADWFIERRKVMDNFLIFPANPIFIGTEKEEKTITRGEFFMVPEGWWHWYGLTGEMKSTEHIILHILFNSKLYPNPLEIFPSVFHRLDNYDVWYERLKQMICLSSYSQNATKRFAEAILTELFLELIANEQDDIVIPDCTIDPRISRTIQFVDKSYADDLTVEDIADKANLKAVQFRKLFKLHTGISPRQYLINVRIRKAAQLLVNTSLRIHEIAEQTGFSNEYYFCTAFKRSTGMNPSYYREHERSKKAP